jgi:hypothetical protein
MALLSSSIARASCGDWLQHSNDGGNVAAGRTGQLFMSEPLVRLWSAIESAPNPPDRQTPCRGPFCSQGPDRQAPPVTVTVVVRGEFLGLAAASSDFAPPSLEFGPISHWSVRPAKGYLRRPDRPPRV